MDPGKNYIYIIMWQIIVDIDDDIIITALLLIT